MWTRDDSRIQYRLASEQGRGQNKDWNFRMLAVQVHNENQDCGDEGGMKYIGTISRERWNEDGIKQVFNSLDGHELILGREIGKGGFEHYQFAMDCAGDLEQYNDLNNCGWHVERAVNWEQSVRYCEKDGRYLYVGNSIEEREYTRIKSRNTLPLWRSIIASLVRQNDREITYWCDKRGGRGKSTLVYILARRGILFPIPRAECDPKRILDYIAMNYKGERIIGLDLPRRQQLNWDWVEALEDIKDGLIASAKYQGNVRFIKGVRILVTANKYIPEGLYKELTEDRWDVWDVTDKGVTHKRGRGVPR